MRIAPKKLTGLIDITVAYIDAANKTGAAIDNNDLAVVAVIYPVGKQDKDDLIERKCLHAACDQFINKFFADRTAAKIIINKTDLYPFLRLLYQYILDLSADLTILKNVILHVDMVFGAFERFQYFGEFVFSIYQKLYFITTQQRAHTIIQQIKCQFFMFLNGGFFGIPGFFGFQGYALAQICERSLIPDDLFTI